MAPWIEHVFELLFKYRPFLFQKGRFVMAPPWPAAVVPQQSFLGVLVDDSQSMRIADDGLTRGQVAAQSFGPEAPLFKALSDRYKLRLFRFSETAERLPSTSDLTFNGGRT